MLSNINETSPEKKPPQKPGSNPKPARRAWYERGAVLVFIMLVLAALLAWTVFSIIKNKQDSSAGNSEVQVSQPQTNNTGETAPGAEEAPAAAAPQEQPAAPGPEGQTGEAGPAEQPVSPETEEQPALSEPEAREGEADAREGEAGDSGEAENPDLDPGWNALLDRLEEEGFEREEMEALFSKLGPSSFSSAFMAAKVRELYGVGGIGINTSNDEPVLPEGYEQPLSEITVGEYKAFKEKYSAEIEDIKTTYGVPANVVVAILLVETQLGSDLGKTPALRSLGSMAATTTPKILGENGNSKQAARLNAAILQNKLKQKSDWAFKELTALIRYGQNNDLDICGIPGSMYGAIGICQFMPSNIEPYGVDGDGDGVINLFSPVDAMYSAANYLSEHGWRGAKDDAAKLRVLMTYNQDVFYAAKVLGVSKQLALADSGKLSDKRNPMYGPSVVPGNMHDPAVRRQGPPPRSARLPSLGNYKDLLK